MKKIITLVLILAVATACVLCFTACTDKDDSVIRVNEVTHSIFYAPLYVAINNGYFEELGIKIELTNGGGADKSMTAVISGQADIGLMGPEAAVYVKVQGSNNYPVVFGQLTKRDGSFLIGRKAEPNFKWSDLAGKEIIGGRQGGMPAMSLEYALKNNELFHGKNLTLNYDIQFDMITAAFEGGTGDYCTMFEPGASQYEKSGKGYIVASVGAEAGAMPYTCFMATKNYISGNPDKVKNFMKAIMKGIDFVMNSSNEVVADALVDSFPTTDHALIVSSVKSYKDIDAYMTSPLMTAEAFNALIAVLKNSNSINKNSSIQFGDIFDNSVIESILAEAK